jgi:HSP20 family protein
MSLIHYEPFDLFDQFSNDIGRLLWNAGHGKPAASGEWMPAVDIREDDDRFVLSADLPGVDRKDVEITVVDHVLTFKGDRATVGEDDREGLRRRERIHGSFLRQFTLPETADTDHISATVNAGVLEISIPKQQKLQPRKITVS